MKLGGYMKFMKQYLMLCVLSIILLSGCSFTVKLEPSNDTISYSAEQEYDELEIETPLPITPSIESIKESIANSSDYCLPSTITERILEADLFSGTIQLANQVVTLPITVHNLYTILSHDQNLNTSISGSAKLTAHSIDTATLSINEACCTLTIANQTDKSLQLDDCRIIGISIPKSQYSNTNATPFILPKGFFQGSSYEDIYYLYGKPSQQLLSGNQITCIWNQYPDDTNITKSLTNRSLAITFDPTTMDAIGYNYSILQDHYDSSKFSSFSISLSKKKSEKRIICMLPDWVKDEYGRFNTPNKIRYTSHLYGMVDYFICASYSLFPNNLKINEDASTFDAAIYSELCNDPILANYNHTVSTTIKQDKTMLRYGQIRYSEYEGIASVFLVPEKTNYAIRIDYMIKPIYNKAGSITDPILSDLKLVYESLLEKSKLVK